jgi:DNA-binding transcriptional LysR family regulator
MDIPHRPVVELGAGLACVAQHFAYRGDGHTCDAVIACIETPSHIIISILEHHYQTVQAALDGLGVALASSSVIRDDVAEGLLVLPLPVPAPPAADHRAYVLDRKAKDFGIVAFCEWLRRASHDDQEGRPLISS